MKIIFHLVLLVWLTGCIHSGSSLEDPQVAKGSGEPGLLATEKGLILSWLEPTGGDILLQMSVHNGIKWTSPKTIAKGDDFIVNWADFPAIVANGDNLFAHYLRRTSLTIFSYDVMYTVSSDFGENWTEPQKLHQDTVIAEHGFVSAVPYKGGFSVSWLDGRNTIEKGGNFTLRNVFVNNNGILSNATELDDNTCTCCQTSMALFNNAPITFYRDRSDEEIRDIYFSRLADSTWTTPTLLQEDNWLIPGCPVNGPRVASHGNTLAVAWFTGAENEEQVKLKISSGEEFNFAEEIIVDGPNAIGRVDVQIDSSKIYVTYLARRNNASIIKLSVFDYQGNLLDSELIATVKADRGTGFPRTALWHEQLIITWTDIDEMKVKVLKYPLNKEIFSARARI